MRRTTQQKLLLIELFKSPQGRQKLLSALKYTRRHHDLQADKSDQYFVASDTACGLLKIMLKYPVTSYEFMNAYDTFDSWILGGALKRYWRKSLFKF